MRSALFTMLCAAGVCAAVAKGQVAPIPAAHELTLQSGTTRNPFSGQGVLVASSAAPAVREFRTVDSLRADDGVSSSTEADLPDAPTAPAMSAFTSPALDGLGQAGVAHGASTQPIAKKYAGTILPGQGALPLSAGNKVTYAVRDAISPYSFLSHIVSATYSQAADSAPHYGQGWAPYGQRIGAAYARGTVQVLATEAVFDNVFRDDPRYYVLGRQHKFLNRVVYAATRVVITRTDSGHNTLNAPLLLGYAAASGANFAYYPERDRDFGDAAVGYAGSLGGGLLGFEVSEFLPDALRIVHLRHD